MKNKPIYKLMDSKGRVLIPKELRTASGMDYGDIVRLGVSNGTVSVQKVDIIEIGDQSPEAVEAMSVRRSRPFQTIRGSPLFPILPPCCSRKRRAN